MSKFVVLFAVPLALSLSALACSDPPPQKPTAASTANKPAPVAAAQPVTAAMAQETFAQRCGPCHGTAGKGDGAGAAALNPKPRDYTDAAWQKSVTDEQLKKAILYGGAAVGKSPMMPGSPDLEQKPEMVDALVKVVRGFGPK